MKHAAFAAALILSAAPFLAVLAGGLDGLVGVPMPDPPVPGDSDTYEQAWHFWWVGTSIRSGTDPRVCPLIGLPEPYSLVGSNIGWPDALLVGLAGSSDLQGAAFCSLLWGTLLVACAGFLFARSWGLEAWPSALASVASAWAPARAAHVLQHYHVAGFGWVLLSMALLRIFLTRGGRGLLPVFALSLLLASMQSAYHTLFGALGSLLVAISTIASRSVPAARTASASGAFAVAMILSYLFFASFPGGMPPGMGRAEAVYWSAEPVSFLLPSPFGAPWALSGADPVMPWMPNLFEGVVTPGLTVLLLAAAFLLRNRSRAAMTAEDRKGLILLALLSLIPFSLALGPWLKFMGVPVGIPMPFAIVQDIPMLEGARSPSRFAILGACMLAVPAAAAAVSLGRRAGIAAALLVVLELVPPGLPTISAAVPSVYREGLPGETALEIPATEMARRHGYFMTADGRARPVFFHTRRSTAVSDVFDPFRIDSPDTVSAGDAIATGVDVILYNRWMYDPVVREEMDSRFGALFPGASSFDSVWVWRR